MSSRRKQSKPKAAFETAADENNKTENSSLVANNADTVTSISKPEEEVVNNNVPVIEENGGSGENEAANDDVIKEPVQEQTSEVVDNEPMINSDAFEANNRKRKREDESTDIDNKVEDKRVTNYTELEYIGGGKETEDSNEDEESGENSNPSSTGGDRNEGGVDLDALDDEDQGVGEEEDILGEETGMYEDEDEMGLMDDDMMANMTASGDLYSNSSPSRRVGGPGAANFSSLDQNASLLLVFKCKVCGKGFKHRRSLNRHVKLHSGEKNFKCPYCSTAFARSDHLKAHIRTHNNMKPYRCSVCHCGYSTQAALKVHIAHHHSKSKFRCVLCNNLEFHSQLALEGHIYTKHSKENKTNIDELINETATINPEIVNVEEATNYNLINQRTRLIEINNYTNLNKSGGSQNGGSNSNLNGSIVQQNGVNNSNGVNVRYSPSDSSIHHHNNNHHSESKSNRNGNNYYDDEEAIHTNNSNEENDANSIYGTENGHYQNGVVKPEENDEDKNDDLIIEEEVRPSPGQRPIAPRGGYNPHMAVNRGPIVPPASTQANTYCELCNARFSSVESYAAHMRNCHPTASVHPSITPTIRGASQPPIASPITDNKMPYLTSILSTPSNNLPLNKNGPIVNKTPQQTQATALSLAHHSSSNSSIHSSQQLSPALNNSCSINPASTAPGIINRGICTVPGCNCASSKDALRQYNSPPPSQHMDNYVHKDTHYTCVQCNLSGLNNTAYMAHIKSTHCVEVYRCILCKQMQLFDNLTLLKEHFFLVHAAHKYDVIKCNVCPPASSVTFANVDELGHHVKAIHRPPVPPPFHNGHHLPPTAIPPHHLPPSQPPPPPVSQQPTSHHHLINNDRFKCYKCQYCDSDFTQPNALQQHIQIVHPNQYHNHHQPQQQHHQPATFSCQYCRNTFSNRGQLERHMRMHLTTVDLKCNICDRTFENEELLSEHKLTHSKTLTTNTNNINISESPSSQISSCAFCKQPIETDQQFKEHFKRHNNIGQPNQAPGNRFMCPVCRQMLTSNSEYGIHVRSHVKRNTANSPSQSQPANKELKNGPVKLENGSAEENGIYIKVAPAPANSNPALIKDELSSTQIPSAQIPPVNSQKPADFLCEICSSKFETNTKLQAHLLLKHEHQNQQQNGVFICPVCDEQFNRPDVLLFHTSVHGQAAKIYKCSQCPQSYVFKSQLINHSFSHHSQSHHQRNGGAPIMSSQSNRVMPAQSQQGPNGYNLRSHSTSPVKQTPPPPTQIQSIPGDNNQVFGVAGAQYTVNSNGAHKTYTCLTCSKTFANQRNLNVHLRIHTGFRPFECDVCKHKFTRRENLRSHMKCHLNLRPFTCPICTRSFRRRSHVTSHIEVHFKSKVHNCVECSVQFDRLEAYLKHLITEHSAHDRELIALIRSRNILDLSQFDIPENPPNNPNNNGANSITIQSLIDDQDQQSYENDDEYAENGGVASVEEEEEVNNDDPGLEEDEPNEYIDDPATEHNFENYGGDDNEEIDFTD